MRYIILLLTLTACGAFPLGCGPAAPRSLPALSIQPAVTPLPATRDGMEDYASRAITLCSHHMSPAAAGVLAADVAQVATQTFPHDRSVAEAFVALLCIESGFDQSVKSPVNATGIAQLMPQYFSGFAAECGLGAVVPGDISNQAINLRLGACHFKKLVEDNGGNIPLALASYNAGSASRTLRNLKAGGNGAAETDGYITRHYVVTQRLQKEEKK